ncbi:MAG: hypothetical protein ACFE95_04975 [Candidatus Hodarchaeota archaeon]
MHKILSDENNRWLRYALASLLINLLVHLIVGLIYYNPVDFVLQFEAAKEIARGSLLYRDIGEIVIDGNKHLPRPQYPPLYLYSLAFFIILIGVDIFTWQMAKLFLIVFNLFVGTLIYYIVIVHLQPTPRNHFIALGAFNWFLLNPLTLGVVFGGYHENFMLFFVLLAFIMFKNKNYFRSGVFFGLALLVKPTAGVYMLPLVVWGIQKKDWKSSIIWLSSGLTFLLGSLPFLILTPISYINDVFVIHAQRPDPSMSFYNYFFTEFSTSLIPFFIQFLVSLVLTFLLMLKIPLTSSKEVIQAVLPFMTIFLVLNRILYPHYMPFFFPFFTVMLFFLISQRLNSIKIKNYYLCLFGLLIGLLFVYLGDFWWSILWAQEGYETYLSNPLFPISAGICILGLVIISISSIYTLYISTNNKRETDISEDIVSI